MLSIAKKQFNLLKYPRSLSFRGICILHFKYFEICTMAFYTAEEISIQNDQEDNELLK